MIVSVSRNGAGMKEKCVIQQMIGVRQGKNGKIEMRHSDNGL